MPRESESTAMQHGHTAHAPIHPGQAGSAHAHTGFSRSSGPSPAVARRRWPVTLWLHVTWELWRLLLLSTAVLVTVISFAAAIKPMADGKLGPIDTIRFMLLAMPPMLQYALPFAACFGATLAYYRMASDNEVIAAHAGGISHRALLVPGVLSGMLLALVLLVLTNRIIPSFLRQMGELVSQDISQYIVHQIKSGQAVTLGADKRRFLYADDVVERGADEESGAFQRLWLAGVLLVKIDRDGHVKEQASAREATAWLRRVSAAPGDGEPRPAEAMTEVIIRPRDAVYQQNERRAQIGETIQPFLVPSLFSDNPKYLSDIELRRLYSVPEGIQSVDQTRRELAIAVAEADAIERLRDLLATQGRADFIDSGGQPVVLWAADIRPVRVVSQTNPRKVTRDPRRWQVVPASRGGQIKVERKLSNGTMQSQIASGAELRLPQPSNALRPGATTTASPDATDAGRSPHVLVTLALREVEARDLDENGELLPVLDSKDEDVVSAPGIIREWTLSDLRPNQESLASAMSYGSFALMDMARQHNISRAGAQDGLAVTRDAVEQMRRRLSLEVADLAREVTSKLQERLATSMTCLVMIIVGSVMAMRHRDSLPLIIYLWAFFPALVAVMAISAGQKIAHQHGLVGLPVIWGGVVGLGLYGAWQYARLAKR